MVLFFFFNDTATTEIYTLSLHDALPISPTSSIESYISYWDQSGSKRQGLPLRRSRSEEHTSELQSQSNLVCRLLLEKKKKAKRVTDQPTLERPAPPWTSTRNRHWQFRRT